MLDSNIWLLDENARTVLIIIMFAFSHIVLRLNSRVLVTLLLLKMEKF